MMEEIKPKKERKFLKAMGDIALTLFRELVLGIGKKVINKVGNKRQGLVISFVILASTFAIAQFPNTLNKQRLGFQTTGDGLVWRGSLSDTASIQPINNQSAWVILDTVNLKMYSFDFTSNVWNLVGGGGSAFTQPLDSLFFNTGVPTNNVDTAKMRWDSDLATVVLGLNDNVPNELGFKNFWLVKNQTGSTITKGSIVYANGTVGASGRITVAKFIANGSIDAKYLLGITAHDLTDGEDGYVISFGKIRQVNTDTFAAGAILYPSPTVAGVWTDVEPIAPNIDMPIGFCINSSVNNGTIAIRVASGYKLLELHDVAISSPVEKSSLYYSGGLWRDTTAALLVSDTASMLLPYLRDADTVTLSNRIDLKLNIADTSAFARDNQISGTSGQVAYFNSSSSVVSDANLRWSAANKSLGINTTTTSGANLIIKNSQEPNAATTVIATQTFGADTINWTRGAGWTFNGTQAVSSNTSSNLSYSSPLTLVANRTYLISVNITISGGDLSVLIGNSITNLQSTITTYLVTPTSISGGLRFQAQSVVFTGTIDNVLLQEVTITAPVLIAGQDDNTTALYNPIIMPNSSTLAIGGGGTITRGTDNVFFGTNAGQLNTIGANNLFVGANSGRYNTTGIQNIFIGANSGIRNVNGQDNVFLGNNSGLNNTSGYSNTFIGASAGSSNTVGIENTYIGVQAGFLATSSGNTLIGSLAGRTGASESTIIGYNAGRFGTNNLRNTIIGYRASANNVSGIDNVIIGHNSGSELRTGSRNVFVGRSSGVNVKQGNNNVFLGFESGYNLNTSDTLIGSNNIAFGTNAADNIAAAAAGNVAIGNAVDLPTNNGSNQGVYQNVLFFTGASGTGTTIAAASKAGIKTNAPNRDLEVAGEVRITDLTTDAPTRLVGADADGDLGQVTLGAGLSLASSSLLADTSFLVTRFDTASMLTPYFRDADTTSLNLTSRFAAKLNLSDTASMLTNYLRTGTAASTYLPLTGGTLSGDLGVSKSSNSILRLSSADVGSYGKLIFSSNNGGFLNYGASIESSGDGVGVDVGSLNFLTGFGTVRTNRMTITPTGNLTIVNSATIGGTLGVTGATTLTGGINGNIKTNGAAGATATPDNIWLGNSYSNGTTRDKLKIYLYNDGTEKYGFGVGSIGDIQYHSNTTHDFYIANTKKFFISNTNTTTDNIFTVNSSAVFNEAATDSDFRVESEANAHMLFVDASTSKVGIGYASPTKTLDVNGEVRINTVTAPPTSLLGKDGSNVVGEVTTVAQTGLMTRGETTATTGTPSATFTVTHGLGVTPTSVLVTSAGLAGAEKIIFEVYAKNSTTFSVQAWNYDGTEASSKSVKIFWLAIK